MAMEQIGIFEAKAHFSEVIERVVQEGRPVTITRRGKPMVDITPTKAKSGDRMTHEQARQELKKLRQEVEPMSVKAIVDLIHQGRT